jgi:hypothetical protein
MAMRASCHPRWQGITPDLHGRTTARDSDRNHRSNPPVPGQFHDLDANRVVTPQAGSTC